MVQVLSKILTAKIADSCTEMVHPGTSNCFRVAIESWSYIYYKTMKMYLYFYLFKMLLKRRKPTKQDLKRTIIAILQSSLFFTMTLTGVNFPICILSKFVELNLITGIIVPSALASLIGILLERQSRRLLLALYCSQETTFAIWKMLQSRGLVKPVPYGTTILFSVSTAIFLMCAKAGLHINKNSKEKASVDFMISALRYILGEHEEKGYLQKNINEIISTVNNEDADINPNSGGQSTYKKQGLVMQVLRIYHKLINKIKCQGRYKICPHSFSCLHYVFKGSVKSFLTGVGIQSALNLVLNIPKIIRDPKYITKVFLQRQFLAIPLTLMVFTGIFRTVCCSLRWTTGKDKAYHTLVAGLLAGTAYSQFGNNTLALYVLWKSIALLYKLGIETGYFPKIPYGPEIQFALCGVVLFYIGIFEPNCIRPGYWKTIHDLTGGRFCVSNRENLNALGFDSVQQLETILRRTNTKVDIKMLFG